MDRRVQAFVGVRNHQLGTIEPNGVSDREGVPPRRFPLRGAEPQIDDFPMPIGVGRDGYYSREPNDPPAMAQFEAGRIEPDAGPVFDQGPIEKLVHPIVLSRQIFKANRQPGNGCPGRTWR